MFEVASDATCYMATRLQVVYLQQITTVFEIMKNGCVLF